jgi:signal transduction histidine kinase
MITALAILLALFIARSIVEPLRLLTTAARAFGAGDLQTRTLITSKGTLRELGLTFNQMAEQIAEREEKLKALDRLKSEFVSNVSHELRTPLTTIKTLITVLRNGKITKAEREDYLQTIAVECDRQIDFIQNLLDLSRIESGAYKVKFNKTDVTKVITSTVEMQQRAAASRNLHLKAELPKNELPKIETDAAALQRVIVSLIENAMKYTPEKGEIRLSAENRGENLAIIISDNGCGIAKEDLPHIFERYYRGRPFHFQEKENTDDPDGCDELQDLNETAGIGLGLYLVNALIEQICGEIIVESPIENELRGTRFTILLPLKNISKNTQHF